MWPSRTHCSSRTAAQVARSLCNEIHIQASRRPQSVFLEFPVIIQSFRVGTLQVETRQSSRGSVNTIGPDYINARSRCNLEQKDPYCRSNYPLLIVISGPSGVGKDTIARQLIEREPEGFHFVVTATTRPPRAGEIHGKDYFFVDTDEFARMIDAGELLEHALVYNDYRGVPKQQIREAFASGKDVIMRVDVQGAATIRKLVPNAVFLFLMAESDAAMLRRLHERKSETPEALDLRMTTALQEMRRIEEFDYCVVNPAGRPDQAVADILCIMRATRCQVHHTPIEL